VLLEPAERGKVRLIMLEIIFEEFKRMSSKSTHVTDGRTDGQLALASHGKTEQQPNSMY